MTKRLKLAMRGGILMLLALGMLSALAATADTGPISPQATGGTIVALVDGAIIAAHPDGTTAHLVADDADFPGHFVSVSMDDNGIIYAVNSDSVYAFTQSGDVVGSWDPPHPGEGELLGGISDSEVRRDGAAIITQSIWSNCTGGGLTDICNVRSITAPGSDAVLGTLTNRSTATWLGSTDTVVVNGGLRYYRLGAAADANWFEDEDLVQGDARPAATPDGKFLALGAPAEVPGSDSDFSAAISFYSVQAAPPAEPTLTCRLFVDDLVGEEIRVEEASFSPDGRSLAFIAGSEDALFVVSNLNLNNCSYGNVMAVDTGISDVFWSGFDYDPTHGPGPGDPDGPGGPGTPAEGFDDVPSGHVFNGEIGWLAASGITRGCNPPDNTRFCPDDQVTRGQMAAFLVRALGLDAAGGQGFTDTGSSVFAGDIDALAAAGITRGCNPPDNTRFCPDDRVTRGQMAAFLYRALSS